MEFYYFIIAEYAHNIRSSWEKFLRITVAADVSQLADGHERNFQAAEYVEYR